MSEVEVIIGIAGNNGNRDCVPQLQGTWTLADLCALLRLYHGRKGEFAYRAYDWLNDVVWDRHMPLPLMQWALTPYGRCLGMTRSELEQPPVITLHPAIWKYRGCVNSHGWAANIQPGPRYTLDVVLHELIHVEVDYLRGGHSGKSSHDNPVWCAAIERAAERLRGTMLELRPFRAQPTKRIREDGYHRRRTPDGCLTMDECSRWPHSIRASFYYGEQSVPME